MFGSVTGREFVIVLVIALVVLAGSQLPRLMRALASSRHDSEPGASGAPKRPPEAPSTGVDPASERRR
jgi:hypothetical protein